MSETAVVWVNYSQAAERLEIPPGKVRSLVQDRSLLARRVEGAWKIPEVFLEERVMRDLRGTATVLIDGGFSDDEALTWFLRDDQTLGVPPVEAIRQGRSTEVRRLAQSLAL